MLETVLNILPRSIHSLGSDFEIQFIRRWIVEHINEILPFNEKISKHIKAENIEYKRIILSIPSAVHRDHVKFHREQIINSINSFAAKTFGINETIVDEVIFTAKKSVVKNFEHEKFYKLSRDEIDKLQKKILMQENLRHEIRLYLLKKPWAFFNEVQKIFPTVTPKILNRARSELINQLARKITSSDYNTDTAKILTMLHQQLPPNYVDDEKILQTFSALKYNLAKE